MRPSRSRQEIPGGPPRSRVIAGIDEAGLGPLLGPLSIGYSVFRLPEPGADPWRLLAPMVGKRAHKRAKLVVADSKRVFQRSQPGAKRLESTALGFLALLDEAGRPPASALDLVFGDVAPDRALVARHPWYEHLPAIPAEQSAASLELLASLLGRRMREKELEILDAGVRLVPAGELNLSYGETENKGATVWLRCAEVLRHLWDRHGESSPRVTVDLLGGRIHYADLLREAFPEARVDVLFEGPEHAAYRLDEAHERAAESWLPKRMSIEFLAKGEDASFAVALASCLAKYTRELVMEGFNAYFGARDPELAPTAGYTTDGRRWLADARGAIRSAGIPDDVLVRER